MSPTLTIAATGAANLASVRAMCARANVHTLVTEDPEVVFEAERVLLPGVGAFGAAMASLKAHGLDEALRARIKIERPTMGICLGMQMMCLGSEESPDVPGLGVVPAYVEKFRTDLPLPQLGWNRIETARPRSFVLPGWAYFANSYRVSAAPEGFGQASSVYGEAFAATLERYAVPGAEAPFLFLCQFHPELSGPWGLELFMRWMESEPQGAKA
jgi:imidazole glycerol phosphate synthase glutamine amidotransferase subunit